MTTPATDDQAAREAAIRADERQRIAEEVKTLRQDRVLETDYDVGFWSGITLALRIIERGAQPEGEQT